MARRPRRQRTAPRPRRPTITDPVDAALALAAEKSWREVTLSDIAARAGMDLVKLHETHRSKTAILAAFVRRVDAAMLAGTSRDAEGEPIKDRLTDALLRRVEFLTPHKAAIASIARDGTSLCMAPLLMRSMAWTLESAGAGPSGPFGLLRTNALAAIYLSALWIWLRDDDPDLARTMAHLDRRLTQADQVMSQCRRLRRPEPKAL
jgi:AcrR family transcriptional regulator